MIKMQIIGFIGQDATINNVNGKSVINFSVAHSEKYKTKDGLEVDKSIWANCAYWSDRINVAMYLKKGTQVYVEGTPEAKTYTNKNNEVIPQLQIRVAVLNLLSSSKTQGAGQDFLTQPNGFETDIPF
jgi:single-strand DNA-binding protein